MSSPGGRHEQASVESQIVWRNVDDEAMTKDFARLNSSCSPHFVSPGMAALLAHGNRRLSSGEPGEPPSLAQIDIIVPSSDQQAAGDDIKQRKAVDASLPLDGERRKSGREMFLEEEERLRKLEEERPPVLVMGTEPMCNVGGCGYFSDDGK